MGFLSGLGLVLLTLVGYSSGMAIGGGDRDMKPVFMDMVFVALLWIVAFLSRETLGRWGAIIVWLIMALLISMTLTRMRLRNETAVIMPDSELPEHARETKNVQPISGNIFKRMWEGWKAFAAKMGNVQGRMIMGFFYFVIVTPFGLGSRILSDPLTMKKRPSQTGWMTKDTLDTTLETARKQG